AGPDAEDDLRLDADHLHLPARVVPGRSRHLLDVEQLPHGVAAGLHHEEARRQNRTVGQSARAETGEEKSRRIAPAHFHETALRHDPFPRSGSCALETTTMIVLDDISLRVAGRLLL